MGWVCNGLQNIKEANYFNLFHPDMPFAGLQNVVLPGLVNDMLFSVGFIQCASQEMQQNKSLCYILFGEMLSNIISK